GSDALSDRFYTRLRGLIEGPFTVDELKNRARRRRFGRHYQVSTDQRSWSPATSFPELFPAPPERRRRRAVAEPADGDEELEAVDLVEEPAPGADDEGVVDAIPLQAQPQESEPGWWYVRDDRECGPVSLAELRSFAAAGHLLPATLVWTEGWQQWGPAEQVPDLFLRRGPHAEARADSQPEPTADRQGPEDEPPPTAPMAVASLVLGVSVVGCILAVVFGHVALNQIHHSRKSRRPLGGRGMALAGIIIGYTTLGLVIVAGIVFAIVKLLAPEP
ncbi:MAG TPA: GYF domain-containing protein, partial [Planctomycetaceae bacterium]|nr:GYF domain-containing protein [Planctomycetaceae bacterium]